MAQLGLYKEWLSRDDINKVFEETNKMLLEGNLTPEQEKAVRECIDGFIKFLREFNGTA